MPRTRARRGWPGTEQSCKRGWGRYAWPRHRNCTAWILYSNSADRPIGAHNNQFGEVSGAVR
jgi:hypothetical protein